jgi:sec-independent protein translocase protein TatA
MLPSAGELILVLLIAVVIFGGKKIPEIMGGIGKGIRTFKKTMESDEPTPPPSTQSGEAPKEKVDTN